MAQHDFNIANQGFPAFRTDLNNALSAINSTQSGTSTPSGAVAGTIWLDTTSATTPTLKYYDGTDNISLATIDHVGNTVNWLDSTVSITGLSTTATGTVLTLTDSASTSTVNLIIDNQKEIRFRETTGNGTNYVALKAPASLSADLTFTLPSADGTNGQVLSTNGSGVLSFITPASGIAFQSAIKTSGFTAVAGEGYFCNTTSSAFTVTLPASPSAGNQVAIVDYAGTFDTNALTISPNGNKIEGATASLQLTGEREGVLLVYADSTQGWLATSGINEGTDALSPEPYSVDFLVIAGGGGGGTSAGSGYATGGGGAGGYRTSTQTVNIGTVITVTVGDGGGASTNGSNSSISGSGLSTITSAGGGSGGFTSGTGNSGYNGANGGSGGGGGCEDPGIFGAGGTGNTPSTSPSQGNNGGIGNTAGQTAGGGGGGANAVGGNGASSTPAGVGGNGGAGTASSITGSSVTRAGGGGGGGGYIGGTGTGGTGGTGGGGNGSGTGNGTAGTANTGGGGGGARGSSTSGSGGKGVVILSIPTASYSSTTTGSPTVTTSGSNTILQFNGSGSYTA
jgi:hypothetical protein